MKLLAEISHNVSRQEASFDRACDEVYRFALMHFQIDNDGHSASLPKWERSRCYIECKFVGYLRVGHEHTYNFIVRACRN